MLYEGDNQRRGTPITHEPGAHQHVRQTMMKLSAIRSNHAQKPRVMHVGKFYSPHRGGIETHVEALCKELLKSMDVRVLVADDSRRGEECVIDGVTVSRFAQSMNIAGAPVCPAMVWKIRKHCPDIVHLHLPNPGGVLAVLASGYRGRVVVSWHSDVIRQHWLGKVYNPIQRILLRNCSAIVASSPNYIQSSAELSRFKSRCHVIPYGIDSLKFQNADPAEVLSIRERFGPKIVLMVGRLVYYKGVEHALRAMTMISGANLLIIGDGPLKQTLQLQARELGVADRVFFLGQVQGSISSYYQASDVFVLASIARSEAFGIVQLEAMASGKPVVNTHLATGVPFVSIDGETGITVPPGSPESIAVAVNRLLDDPALRSTYGHAAMRRVQGEFNLDLMVRRTIEVYREAGAEALAPYFASNGASQSPPSPQVAGALAASIF
jgi:glycosyltransferase involved in cell wall biosynthesis